MMKINTLDFRQSTFLHVLILSQLCSYYLSGIYSIFSFVDSVSSTCDKSKSTQSIGISCSVSELTWTTLVKEDAMLLHYAYSDKYASHHSANSALFRRLSSVFTRGIEVPLLRYSVLAYLAHHAPNCKKYAWREMQYRKIALQMLQAGLP